KLSGVSRSASTSARPVLYDICRSVSTAFLLFRGERHVRNLAQEQHHYAPASHTILLPLSPPLLNLLFYFVSPRIGIHFFRITYFCNNFKNFLYSSASCFPSRGRIVWRNLSWCVSASEKKEVQ
ncbi:unnamed protein product, partial [Amoebophrya sp. A120]